MDKDHKGVLQGEDAGLPLSRDSTQGARSAVVVSREASYGVGRMCPLPIKR